MRDQLKDEFTSVIASALRSHVNATYEGITVREGTNSVTLTTDNGLYIIRVQKAGKIKMNKRPTRICATCNRDIKSPLFDGCMNETCPNGFTPCL